MRPCPRPWLEPVPQLPPLCRRSKQILLELAHTDVFALQMFRCRAGLLSRAWHPVEKAAGRVQRAGWAAQAAVEARVAATGQGERQRLFPTQEGACPSERAEMKRTSKRLCYHPVDQDSTQLRRFPSGAPLPTCVQFFEIPGAVQRRLGLRDCKKDASLATGRCYMQSLGL